MKLYVALCALSAASLFGADRGKRVQNELERKVKLLRVSNDLESKEFDSVTFRERKLVQLERSHDKQLRLRTLHITLRDILKDKEEYDRCKLGRAWAALLHDELMQPLLRSSHATAGDHSAVAQFVVRWQQNKHLAAMNHRHDRAVNQLKCLLEQRKTTASRSAEIVNAFIESESYEPLMIHENENHRSDGIRAFVDHWCAEHPEQVEQKKEFESKRLIKAPVIQLDARQLRRHTIVKNLLPEEISRLVCTYIESSGPMLLIPLATRYNENPNDIYLSTLLYSPDGALRRKDSCVDEDWQEYHCMRDAVPSAGILSSEEQENALLQKHLGAGRWALDVICDLLCTKQAIVEIDSEMYRAAMRNSSLMLDEDISMLDFCQHLKDIHARWALFSKTQEYSSLSLGVKNMLDNAMQSFNIAAFSNVVEQVVPGVTTVLFDNSGDRPVSSVRSGVAIGGAWHV